MAKFQIFERLIRLFRNQQGMILLLVTFILIMISMWGAATLTLTTNEYQKALSYRKVLQAHYLAEAGIEEGLMSLKREPLNFQGIPEFQMETGSFTVDRVEYSPGHIVLMSTGKVKNIQKTLKAEVLVSWDNTINDYLISLIDISE